MTLTDLLVPTYRHMLTALSNWLDKAEAQLGSDEADALLSASLAPDMFPLATQVRFACVQAREGVHRLTQTEFSPRIGELLEEGRKASEHPGTLAGAKARIGETLTLLEDLAPDALDLDGDHPIAHGLPIGLTFDLTADQYARDWALGQFYFHIMTAYAILRSRGVEIGKRDYIPHMMPFLRAAPEQG